MAFNLQARLSLLDNGFTRQTQKATKQLDILKNASQKVSGGLSKMSDTGVSGMSRMKSSSDGLVTKLTGLAATIGATALAMKGLNATFGGAARLESEMISMEHFMGLTKGAKEAKKASEDYVKYLRNNANLTPFETGEVISAGRRSLQVAGGDVSQAKNMLKIAQDMVALNPGKTLSDGMEALADLAVGETERMKEFGFKITQKDIKAAGGAFKVMNGEVAKMFEGGAQKLANSSTGLMSTITGTITSGLSDMGVKALEILKPQMEKLANFMSSGGMDKLVLDGANALATATEKVIAFGQKAIEIGKFVYDNWKPISDTLLAAAAATAVLKAGFVAMSIVSTITGMMTAYRTATVGASAAQAFLNGVLLANPIGLVIGLLAALTAAGVYLYRNFDTVAAKMDGAWQWIKNSASTALNFVIDKINDMIGMINKIPGVQVPIVPKIDTTPLRTVKITKKDTSKSMNDARAGLYSGHGHHGGLSRVPYDGYMVRAHKNEQVLTAQEAKEYRNGGKGGGVTINIASMNVRKESDIKSIAEQLANEIARVRSVMA